MWKLESFSIATEAGILKVNGATCRGIGMYYKRQRHHIFEPPPLVSVTHLGSGHEIVLLMCGIDRAGTIIDEILAIGDWEFDGLDGWRNQIPNLQEKLLAVVKRHRDVIVFNPPSQNDAMARAIARDRW